MKKGESKTIAFLIKRNGVALDMSDLDPAPTFKWAVKRQREDSSYILEKEDEDFDKTDIATGYAKVNVTATDTADIAEGTYLSELKTSLSEFDVDKSNVIDFTLEKSVIHD
jgi:hypothetical protein